jgi:aminopeptidase N
MKKILLAISLLFSCFCASGQANTNMAEYDITHSALDLSFDWQNKSASGTATIDLTLLKATSSIHLAAKELDISAVKDERGQAFPFVYEPSRQELRINLPKTLKSKTKLQIVVQYTTRHINESDPNAPGGSYGKGLRFFQASAVMPAVRSQIWSQSEAENAPYWFPCSQRLDDLRTTELRATVDKKLTVISNGQQVELRDNPDGTRTFLYRTDFAYPAYLTAFVVGEYTDYVQYYKKTPLHTFCYPDEVEATKATTVRLADMMDFMSQKTGLPYPFATYSQVMVQDYPFPSLTGQPSMSIISDNMIDDYGTHKDFQYLWDGVEFNAVASQWFGTVITPKTWGDVWLTKAFAQYYEGLYTAAKHGQDEYLIWYHPFETGSIFGDWNSGNRHPIYSDQVDNGDDFTADNYAKFRGALVLRMLQQEVGETAFQRSVQRFIRDNAFKPVTTAQFQDAIEAETGKRFQWFFDQWIYKTGHPVFGIQQRYDAAKKQLRLTVKQIQAREKEAKHAQNQYFQGKVFVEIDGRTEEARIENKPENTLSFYCASAPKWVHFDCKNVWIKEVQHQKTMEEYLHQMRHSKDASARQTAINALTALAQKDSTPVEIKQRIYSGLKDVLNTDLYWRTRVAALTALRNIYPKPYDKAFQNQLVRLIKNEQSWLKTAAITTLSAENDPQYADLYISCLSDTSDRVLNTAAVALGKTKDPRAYEILTGLCAKPSWKSQSLMHCLVGLAALGDPRGADIALEALRNDRLPRWFLATTWDYPFVAAQTLHTLGASERGYSLLHDRLQKALANGNRYDMLHQLVLIVELGTPQSSAIFDLLKKHYEKDAVMLSAIIGYEKAWKVKISGR